MGLEKLYFPLATRIQEYLLKFRQPYASLNVWSQEDGLSHKKN